MATEKIKEGEIRINGGKYATVRECSSLSIPVFLRYRDV
jgi:hypothetical protein